MTVTRTKKIKKAKEVIVLKVYMNKFSPKQMPGRENWFITLLQLALREPAHFATQPGNLKLAIRVCQPAVLESCPASV